MKSSRLQRVLHSDGGALTADILSTSSLQPRFFGHSGFPETTDALAYDPVQRLLAVGTADGRVKVFGRDTVECTFKSPCQCATKHLQFLDGKGALLRVTQDGDVQLWGVEAAALLDSMPCEGDLITVVEPLADEPYILLGCDSGNVQVAALLGASGTPVLGAREACSLSRLPHTISTDDIGIARGAVVVLAALSIGDQHRVLIVHEDSGAVIWDLRHQCVVVYAHNSFSTMPEGSVHSAAGKAAGDSVDDCPNDPTTAACWVGPRGDCIATGHKSGTIRVWGLPASATGEVPPEMPEPAHLHTELRLAPAEEPAAAVRALRHVSGAKPGGHSSLLVLGGQDAEQPDVLSMLPLQGPTEEAEGAHALPWFGAVQGFALVPPEGCLGAGAAGEMAGLIVLSEGGQLMVHDLRTLQPVPLSLPFQELPPITASAFAPGQTPVEEGLETFPHAVSLAALRAARSVANGAADSPERGVSRRWRWVLAGGRPALPCSPPSKSLVPSEDPPSSTDEGDPSASADEPQPEAASALYFTGHRDGRVRVWDMAAEVPGLLATVPFDAGGAGSKLRSVSTIQVCTASGLLVVAHQKGEVRVYQFSPDAQQVTCVHLDHSSKGPPEKTTSRQPAGFQAVLRASMHEGAVTSASIASKAGLVALGDASGDLSVLNLSRPSVEFYKHLCDQPIASVAFGLHNFVTVKSSSERKRGSSDTPAESRLSLYVGTADCALTLLDARHGEPAGIGRETWLRPKHADSAVGMALLDAAGCPLLPPAGPALLPWAGNTPAAAAPPKAAVSPPLPQPAAEEATAEEHVASPAHEAKFSSTAAPPTSKLGASPALQPVHDGGHIGFPSSAREPPAASPFHGAAAGAAPHEARSGMHGQPALPSRAAQLTVPTRQGSPGPQDPLHGQERRGSVKGDSESDAAPSDNEDEEDDHDDLLAAAAAAVDAQQKEASKAGKKKFGLLGRGSGGGAARALSARPSEEEGHLVSSHTAKSGLGRWVRRGSENSQSSSPRSLISPRNKGPSVDPAQQESSSLALKHSAEAQADPPPKKTVPTKEAPSSSMAATTGPARTSPADSAELPPAVVGVAATSQPTRQETSPPDPTHDRQTSAPPAAASKETSTSMATPASAVSHIMLASSGSLRLYAADNLRTADRTTLKKAALDGRYGFAGAFSSAHGPGVACISPDGTLKVYTLPGLELVLAQRLEEALTFPWAWTLEPAQLARLCATDPTGQLALVGGHGDLARVALAEGTPEPARPSQLYDWDLATAALAAAHAVARELKAAAFPPPPSFQPQPQPQPAPAPPLQHPEGSRPAVEEAGGKRRLGGFLHSVRDVATRVVDDTTKELSKFERSLGQGLDRFGKDIMAARNPFLNERATQQRPPSLAAVFANAPQPDSPTVSYEQPFHSGLDRKGSDESEPQHRRTAAAKERLPQHSGSADAARSELLSGGTRTSAGPSGDRGMRQHLSGGEDDGSRAELLRGARGTRGSGPPTLGGAPPGTRTAEEIKAAYGRSSNARRTEGVGGLMEENQARLAERGEKLRTLQDKTDQMQADAEDFASMARHIREREANKKWWQL